MDHRANGAATLSFLNSLFIRCKVTKSDRPKETGCLVDAAGFEPRFPRPLAQHQALVMIKACLFNVVFPDIN